MEIVSVSSRRRETAQRLIDELGLDCPAGNDFDAVLANPRVDVVNISGPNHVHAAQGIAAAEAEKHILIEKPMAITMDEISRAAQCGRKGRRPKHRQLRAALESAV